MELTGRIIAVLEPKSGVSQRTGNNWMSQEYVIEVPGQYPRRCAFNVFGEERIKQFNIQMGKDLTIQFDIDAREFNGRWYNDFRAYNVVRAQMARDFQTVLSEMQPPFNDLPLGTPMPDVENPFKKEDGGDLPF